MKEGKDDGKKRMMRTWGHILNGLCEVLKNDHKIRPGVFDENFTEMQFAEILFSLMLVSVIREDYDPSSGVDAYQQNIILKAVIVHIVCDQ